MSDFLGRMAGRVLGTLPVAQPLIPSTFALEAGAASEPMVAEIGVQPKTNPAPQIAPPRPHRERLPEAREKAERVPTPPQAIPAQPTVSVKRETPPPVPHHAEPRETAAAPIASWRPAPLHQAPAPHEAHSTAPPEPHETLPILPSQRPSPTAAAPRIDLPRHAAASPAEAAPPVIRVTIGRVDVRAEFPPAAAPRPAPARRAAPALSLDDYLKQRSEGKR